MDVWCLSRDYLIQISDEEIAQNLAEKFENAIYFFAELV